MSGYANINAFPDQNQLFNAASGMATATVQNRLLENQTAQQTLGSNEIGMMSRAALGLLQLPDEASRAAAYPGAVADLQRNGFAKNAPSTYPGEAGLRRVAAMGMSAEDQYKLGLVTAPGLDAAIRGANAPLPGQAGYGGGTSSGGTALQPVTSGAIEPEAQTRAFAVRDGLIKRGMDPDAATAFAANALHESSAQPGTGAGDAGASHGLFQWRDDRYQNYVKTYGHPPDNAPLDEQLDFVTRELAGPESLARDRINRAQGVDGKAAQISEAYLRPKDTVPEMNRRAGTALQLAALIAPPSAQPPASAAPQPVGTQGLVRNADGSVGTPNAGGLATGGPAAPAGRQQPGEVQVAGPGAPTAPTPAAAPAPPQLAPPPTQPPAPQAAPLATGTESPQFQAALELNRRAQALEVQYPYSPQAKAMAASLRAQAALYMQADSVSVDPNTGIQTKALTGERLNAAAPNARYEWDQERGAYVDRTGTHPPVTPPAPRGVQTQAGDIVQPQPGGAPGKVIYTNDPARVAALKAAESQGTATGTAVAGQVPKLMEMGRSAATAIGNIDYGMSQVDKAAQGGIPTGYFAKWLAPASAMAKSLGVSLPGVDPAAVGNIQTAQKTLAVVSGAILQQILGGQSDITDAKLQHFIHAQPGIETDPQALQRVLNWARTQFVYEREMAKAGIDEAARPERAGMLPANWQAAYYSTHGFAPIYNPGTGEMQQPDGGAPMRNAPAPPAPINPSARQAGRNYQTPKGELKWTGAGWVQP